MDSLKKIVFLMWIFLVIEGIAFGVSLIRKDRQKRLIVVNTNLIKISNTHYFEVNRNITNINSIK